MRRPVMPTNILWPVEKHKIFNLPRHQDPMVVTNRLPHKQFLDTRLFTIPRLLIVGEVFSRDPHVSWTVDRLCCPSMSLLAPWSSASHQKLPANSCCMSPRGTMVFKRMPVATQGLPVVLSAPSPHSRPPSLTSSPVQSWYMARSDDRLGE